MLFYKNLVHEIKYSISQLSRENATHKVRFDAGVSLLLMGTILVAPAVLLAGLYMAVRS